MDSSHDSLYFASERLDKYFSVYNQVKYHKPLTDRRRGRQINPRKLIGSLLTNQDYKERLSDTTFSVPYPIFLVGLATFR